MTDRRKEYEIEFGDFAALRSLICEVLDDAAATRACTCDDCENAARLRWVGVSAGVAIAATINSAVNAGNAGRLEDMARAVADLRELAARFASVAGTLATAERRMRTAHWMHEAEAKS